MTNKARYSSIAACIALCASWSPAGLADPDDWHDGARHWDGRDNGLVEQVREATRRFRDPAVATAEGYGLFLGCVSGPQEGAMGVHYANLSLVNDPALNAGEPEVLVYEPQENGRLRLVAVEFLVFADAWDAGHAGVPPVLAGQSFHFTGTPNRYGLPAFYALHAWAWKHNPHGEFVNWNPNVSCEEYAPEA